MISYEEFTKQEAKLENATLEERKAFYADILKKEPEKNRRAGAGLFPLCAAVLPRR